MQTFTLLLAALPLISALQITNPTKNQLWDISKEQTITWNAVNTDPQSFDIYLSHMAAHPPLNSLLAPNVNKNDGTFKVTGLQLPTGETYQINFVAHDKPEQIYAQSQQFNVTGEGIAATKTIEGYTGPTYTAKPAGEDTSSAAGSSSSETKTTLQTATTTRTSGTVTQTSTRTGTSSAGSVESSVSAGAANSTPTNAGSATGSSAPTQTPNAAGVAGASAPLALVFGIAAFFL